MTEFVKHDSTKPDYSLVDSGFLVAMESVAGYNSTRVEYTMCNALAAYDKENWPALALMAGCGAHSDDPARAFWATVQALTAVLKYGELKYSRDNWRYNDNPYRPASALLRHLEYGCGIDSESGLPHSWHVAANCMFLWYLEQKL